MTQTTFQNLAQLKEVQQQIKLALGNKYSDAIQPFIDIISKVMKANDMNEFEALKLIKEETSIYKNEHAPMFFASALVEITEAKHFSDFKK